MRTFATFGQLAAHLLLVKQRLGAAEQEALTGIGKIVVEHATALIGTEFSEWAPLTDRTIEDKAQGGWLGRVSATDPLYRTGELRISISYSLSAIGYVGDYDSERTVTIGTEDIVGVYHEFGTEYMPPRPFLAPSLIHSIPQILTIVGEEICKAFV